MDLVNVNLLRSWLRRGLSGHLFVACFPKSGSTYLCKALELLTGYQAGFVAEHGLHNDQNISPRKLRRLRRPAVIQQHTQGTCNNVRLLREFGIKPIVHVRNLFDVVVSLHDHLRNEDHRVPTGYIHRQYWQLSHREQIDHLIHVHLPWYFGFLVSWHEAVDQLPILLTRYEDLVTDGPGLVACIANHYALNFDKPSVEAALHQAAGKSTRLNRGVVGRGASKLSPQQRATIANLAHAWKVPGPIWEQIGILTAAAA